MGFGRKAARALTHRSGPSDRPLARVKWKAPRADNHSLGPPVRVVAGLSALASETKEGLMKRALLFTGCLLVIATGSAFAQSDLGFKSVGVATGFVSPEDLDGTFSIGVFVDHGTIAPRLGLESRIDFWSTSDEAFGTKVAVSDVALGARAKYFFEVNHPTIRPFAGAGLALHLLHAKATVPAGPGFPEQSISDSETKLGLDIGGGLAVPMNPRWDFNGELWYGIVSDVGQFSIRAGFGYKLGS
jgi:opacity protein-like surface antigen